MADSAGAVVGAMLRKEPWGLGAPLLWVALGGRAAVMVEAEAGEAIFATCNISVRSQLVRGGSHRELGRQ